MSAVTLVNPFIIVPTGGPPPPTVPTLVASASTALAASADATGTFSGYVPALNDLILHAVSSTSTMAAAADPSGWTNLLGSGGELNVAAAMSGLWCYHFVDAGEVSAVAQTYTATGILGAAETGIIHSFAVRGVNTSTPVDLFNTTSDALSSATPHLTAALAGASLSDGSLVLAGVMKDGSSSTDYGPGAQNPAPYSQVLNTTGTQGRWSGQVAAGTTAGVTIPAVSVTPVSADEFIGWAIALAAA